MSTISPDAAATPRALGARSGRREGNRAALFRCAAALLALALGAALFGLVLDHVYAGPDSTAAMFRGFDLVTTLVAAPTLAVASLRLHTDSRAPVLVVTSLAAYFAYIYAYYLFGTGFNDLFLLHIAVFAAAMVTLVLGLRSLDPSASPPILLARPRARLVAVVLGLLTLALAGMWVWAVVDNAMHGTVPAGSELVETDVVVRLGIALDLAVLVPFYGAAAMLLWRGQPWGLLLGTMALVSGLLHQLGYLVAMPMQVAADVPGAVRTDPAEPLIVGVYLLAGILLVRSRKGVATTR